MSAVEKLFGLKVIGFRRSIRSTSGMSVCGGGYGVGCDDGEMIRSPDRLVRRADVPSGSIQTRHQDPEGHSVNGLSHAQAIRSPDG
ncbi:hypothetical protein ACLOJK_037570 [Asimina triloba]